MKATDLYDFPFSNGTMLDKANKFPLIAATVLAAVLSSAAPGVFAPSMPIGSPGMEGSREDPYDVFLITANGKYSTYRHYGANRKATS